jgi:hypothetical protein
LLYEEGRPVNNGEWLAILHSHGLTSLRERLVEEELLHRAGFSPRGVAGRLLLDLGLAEVWEYDPEGEGPILLGRDVAVEIARELAAARQSSGPEGGPGP